MFLINIHILDAPRHKNKKQLALIIVSFHKYDKILAADLYWDLQFTDLLLVFYLLLI